MSAAYERRPIPEKPGWEADTNGRIFVDGVDMTDFFDNSPDPDIEYINGDVTDCRPANMRWKSHS